MNCSQLYIGSDDQLPEVKSKLFSLRKQPSGSEETKMLLRALGTKHVYYLGPHSGCGCGWDFLDVGTEYDDLARQSCALLAQFLGDLEAKGILAKIYSVCIYSIGKQPELEQSITASEFMEKISEFRAPYSSDVAKVFRLAHNNSLHARRP